MSVKRQVCYLYLGGYWSIVLKRVCFFFFVFFVFLEALIFCTKVTAQRGSEPSCHAFFLFFFLLFFYILPRFGMFLIFSFLPLLRKQKQKLFSFFVPLFFKLFLQASPLLLHPFRPGIPPVWIWSAPVFSNKNKFILMWLKGGDSDSHFLRPPIQLHHLLLITTPPFAQ